MSLRRCLLCRRRLVIYWHPYHDGDRPYQKLDHGNQTAAGSAPPTRGNPGRCRSSLSWNEPVLPLERPLTRGTSTHPPTHLHGYRVDRDLHSLPARTHVLYTIRSELL